MGIRLQYEDGLCYIEKEDEMSGRNEEREISERYSQNINCACSGSQ